MLKKDPITVLAEKIRQIEPSVRWTFLVTLLGGMLVHFYSMSHKFFNYFEMGNIFSQMPFLQEDTVALGRWFMPIATNLFTSFSMPVYNTLISLLYLAIASALIVNLLQIRSKVYGALFGLVFVTFPGFTCVLSYGVNCDEIILALLLSILAAYAFFKWKGGIIWGAVLLCFSLGAYQPYMSATIGVVYMMLFIKVFREKTTLKEFAMLVFRSVLMLAAGFALYYLCLKLTLLITGVTLSDYHGVDSMTSFTPKGLAKGLVYTYGYFLSYFFTTAYTYTWDRVFCNVIGAGAFVALLVRRLVTKRTKGAGTDACANRLLLLLFIFLPLGVNAAPFLMADRVGAGVDRYMIFSLMFLWALLLSLLDMCKSECLAFSSDRQRSLVQWAGLLAVTASVLSGFLICNQAYHKMEAMTETTGSLLNRIAARMEMTPGWSKDMPVYFVNCRALVNQNYEVEIPEYDAIKNMPGTFLRSSYSEEAIEKYLEVYLHFPVCVATEEQKKVVEQTRAFAEMKSYPDESSIQVIDGIMVVKISDGEEY